MVFKTHLLRDSVINGRIADPQNYTHGYNTRSKNTGAQSLKDADGAIIAASPLQSGLSPFVTPFTRSPVMTTTQTTAQSLFHSVVSNLFMTPKTKGSTTTAATGSVLSSTPASVPQTVQFITPTVPKTWITTGSTNTNSSISATVGTPTSTLGTVLTPTTSNDSASGGIPTTSPWTVSTPSTTASAEPDSYTHSGTISGLSSVCTSVIDLTSVSGTFSAAAPAAAANFTDTCVTNAPSGVVSSTAQGHKKDSHSKKMNSSLRLEKFSGKSNEDAKSWLLQFAQYCTCYGLDAITKANVFSFHLQDHARIWYNSLSDSIRNNWQSLEAAFKQRFTEDRHIRPVNNTNQSVSY